MVAWNYTLPVVNMLFCAALCAYTAPLRAEQVALPNDTPTPSLEALSTIPKTSTAEPLADPNQAPLDDELSLSDWQRDDWALVQSKKSFVDINGYLRMRGNYYGRMDFGNQAAWELTPNGDMVGRYPNIAGGAADFSYTSMRLRLEPRIHVTPQLQIIGTLDLFDNLILGSTPQSVYFGMTTPPVSLLSRSQVVPHNGTNALGDSIVVKRLWGQMTALNEQVELRMGRMPDHFGLGMLYNNGDCLDCDYGTVADRLSLSFRLYEHVFTALTDWIAKGPQLQPFGPYDPQPVDAVTWDDIMEYTLRIQRQDHPDDIHDAVLHHKQVINYGTSQAIRTQARDFNPQFYDNNQNGYDPTVPPTVNSGYERRDSWLYTGDLFAQYYVGHIELGSEAAIEAGAFNDTLLNGTSQTTSVLKVGCAVEAKYHLRADLLGTVLAMKAGAASGDGRDGFGALDLADTQRGGTDKALHNFQFSPDYHIDLLMFRRLIGTVTDAWYVRPEISYRFEDKVLGRFAAIYSQEILPHVRSNQALPMGLELDADLNYGLETQLDYGQLIANVAGGMLFPLAGFNNPQLAVANQVGSFAWTVQARLYLTF